MNNLKIGESIVVVICLIIIFFTVKFIIVSEMSHDNENTIQHMPVTLEEEKTFDKTEVYVDAMAIVKRGLKAPSTAEFPSSTYSDVIEYETNKFYVRGYVDAENSFGANIRSQWFVDMEYVGDLVKVNELIIN